VGCSELIADKKIPVISFKDIASFQADGMALDNGSSQQFDAMVLATSYKGQQQSLEKFSALKSRSV